MAEYINQMEPIINQIMSDWRIQQEEQVMKAVQNVGVYVDKERLVKALTDARAFYEEGFRAALRSTDVVEVVRCKDCKHYHDFETHFDCNHVCGMDDVQPTDFCSYGERRDNDAKVD